MLVVLSNGLPSPRLLERIPLAIDTDTSPRSLGKKIHDAKKLRCNFIIVVGKEANNGTMKLEMASQPEATKEYVTEVLKGTLDGKECNSRGIEMSDKDGSKYFEALIERYL